MQEEVDKLKEELIKTTFRLNTLADIVINGSLERCVPGYTNKNTEIEHRLRYEWVEKIIGRKEHLNILDIACGAGYGSSILADSFPNSKIMGYDRNEEAIQYDISTYTNPNIEFIEGDAEKTKLQSSYFDLIISFETIEHLNNPENFLREVARMLKSRGTFIVSTPVSKKGIDTHPYNQFHKIEWGLNEFSDLINKFFAIESIHTQIYPIKLTQQNFREIISAFSLPIYMIALKDLVRRKMLKMAGATYEDSMQIRPLTKKTRILNGYQMIVCTKK